MVKFCTNCGTKLGDEDIFCTNCGQKIEDYRKTRNMGKKEISQAKQRLKKLTGGFLPNYDYLQNLKKHYLTPVDGENIKKQIMSEIESRTLTTEEVEDRLNELINEYGKKKNKIIEQKLKIIDDYLKTEEVKTKIEEYYLDEKVILNIKNNFKKIDPYKLEKISNHEIKEFVDKELINKKIVKEDEFKRNRENYLDEMIKDSYPNIELTSFEKDFIKHIIVDGSINEMKEKLNCFSKKIINNREKLGKYDSSGMLIEDGGYKNEGPSLDFKHRTHLEKAEDIGTDVFIKIFDNKLELIETNFDNYFSSNSLNQKRLIYLKDIISLNIGSIKTNQLKDREGGFIYKLIESDSVIILSLINQEKLKLIFDEEGKEELLYNNWKKYKETQENKVDFSPQASNDSIGEDILKYAELYEKGLLTEEEFTALKKKLLGL